MATEFESHILQPTYPVTVNDMEELTPELTMHTMMAWQDGSKLIGPNLKIRPLIEKQSKNKHPN